MAEKDKNGGQDSAHKKAKNEHILECITQPPYLDPLTRWAERETESFRLAVATVAVIILQMTLVPRAHLPGVIMAQ